MDNVISHPAFERDPVINERQRGRCAGSKLAMYRDRKERDALVSRQEAAPEAACSGSHVMIQIEGGRLVDCRVQALDAEGTSALLVGLAMALVQVIRKQQTF